jgi:hypothetical protein
VNVSIAAVADIDHQQAELQLPASCRHSWMSASGHSNSIYRYPLGVQQRQYQARRFGPKAVCCPHCICSTTLPSKSAVWAFRKPALFSVKRTILNWSKSKYSTLVRIGRCGVSCHALPSADCIKASTRVGVYRRQHVPQPAGGLRSSRS